jgi:hypothetical protein
VSSNLNHETSICHETSIYVGSGLHVACNVRCDRLLKCLQWDSNKLCGASFGGSRNTLHIAFCPSVAAGSTVKQTQVNARVWCTPLGAFVRHACALFFFAEPARTIVNPPGPASKRLAQVSLIQSMVRFMSFVLMAGPEGNPFRPPAMPRRQWGTHSQTRLSTPNCDSKPCCRVLSNFGWSPWAFSCVRLPPGDHMPQASGTRWPQRR